MLWYIVLLISYQTAIKVPYRAAKGLETPKEQKSKKNNYLGSYLAKACKPFCKSNGAQSTVYNVNKAWLSYGGFFIKGKLLWHKPQAFSVAGLNSGLTRPDQFELDFWGECR